MQEFPLSGEVTVPHLSVSTEELVLGPCLVGHSLSYSLTLFNTTPVLLPWSIEPDSGKPAIDAYCLSVHQVYT